MQVQPGTAQEIPQVAKIIILVISVIAVILVAAWGKIADWFRGLAAARKKAAEVESKEPPKTS